MRTTPVLLLAIAAVGCANSAGGPDVVISLPASGSIEAERCRLRDADIERMEDAGGGAVVRLSRPTSRLELSVRLDAGAYRVMPWIMADSDARDAIWLEVGGKRYRQWSGDRCIIWRGSGESPVIEGRPGQVVRIAIEPAEVGVAVDAIEFVPAHVPPVLPPPPQPQLVSTSPMDANDVYYGRRLEPRGRYILHGAGQDYRTFHEYSQAMESHKPLVFMYYVGLEPDARERLAVLKRRLDQLGHYTVLQVGVGLPVDDLLAGKRTEAMRVLCDGLRDSGRPVFLRLGFEFNLGYSANPQGYQEAWRVFARYLRSRPDMEHVALVWCYAPDGDDTDFMKYYPGDEHVDWWCYDPFTPQHITNRNTIRFIETARERRFPVMIGESTPRWLGARQGERSWTVWFKRYFDQMRQYPHIKAFCYIAWDWSEMVAKSDSPFSWHWWGDARVWKDEFVFGRWKKELAKPCYVHAADESSILNLLGLVRAADGKQAVTAGQGGKESSP